MRTYLVNWCNITAAARCLNVHENTLRYRLERLPRFAGLQLEDTDQRLVLALQLRLSSLQKA